MPRTRYTKAMTCADKVSIVEVGPRDGLQVLREPLSTANKIELITQLAAAGLRRIEVASFVDPRRVPQMADAEAVLRGLPDLALSRIGLVLNERGALRALAAGVDELGCVCAATDAFGQANHGASSEATVERAARMIALAREHGRASHATIAVAFGCPFTGAVAPSQIVELARALAAHGAEEVVLADTIGAATPLSVEQLCRSVVSALPGVPVRVHFHDTRGAGVANVWAAYRAGVRSFDASVAGLGGCPFAPGSSGNVATEHVAYMFGRSDIHTGVNESALLDTAHWLRARIAGKPAPVQSYVESRS
jgi:hydroxymethylglutaryl-CoA lyase